MGALKILSFSLIMNLFNEFLVQSFECHHMKLFLTVTSKVRGLEARMKRRKKKKNKNRGIVNDI